MKLLSYGDRLDFQWVFGASTGKTVFILGIMWSLPQCLEAQVQTPPLSSLVMLEYLIMQSLSLIMSSFLHCKMSIFHVVVGRIK